MVVRVVSEGRIASPLPFASASWNSGRSAWLAVTSPQVSDSTEPSGAMMVRRLSGAATANWADQAAASV